nr:hypothetical protein [uncultured Desulfuromonas sp.]
MTSEHTDNVLLVKGQSPQANLDVLLDDLKPLKILDLYTLRMRLTGHAVNMLHKGSRDELEPLATVLSRHHIPHWIIAPRVEPLEFSSPETIRHTAAGVVFTQDGRDHLLIKDSEPLIVLVDITAQVVERIIKRSQVQYAYTGGVHTDQNHDDLRREIFRQQPRIVLAWGGPPQRPDHLFYLSPWDIPPEILGDKARPSRQWNLFEFLEILCRLCPKHYLDTGFGIGFLPDYRVFPCDATDHSGINKNLATLTRYTALLLDMAHDNIQRQRKTAGSAQQATHPLTSLATAFQLSGVVPPGQAQTEAHKKAPRPSLPAPPSPRMQTGLSLHFNGWRLLANLGAVAVFFFVEVNHKAAGNFYHYGFSSGLAPLGVSGLCLWNALFFWRLRQRIKNTATSKARSAAMGMVELYGKAKRQYALVSPNTQQPCVYYALKRYRRTHKDQWRLTSITTSDTVPFILEDDTGRITVNPHGATFRLKNSHSSSDLTSANEKWVEDVIYEDSMVYVLGFASTARKQQGSLSHRVAEKLRDLKGNREQMLTYDRDGDGNVSSAEWDEARADMEQEALHERLLQGRNRSNEQLVLSAPPQKDLPFIIAETESEASLVSHYSWQVPLLLIAGLAAFAWAIKAGVTYFHLI